MFLIKSVRRKKIDTIETIVDIYKSYKMNVDSSWDQFD